MNYHYDSKSSGESIKNYKKNNSGSIIQNSLYSQNEDSFFNFDDEEMLERPSKVNNVCDEFGNNEEYNINTSINSNNINKKSSINSYNNPFYSSNSNNLKYIDISNNKIIPTINSEYTFEINFRENSTFPDVIFPSMSDKKSIYISSFFSSEKFFIYFVKALFGIINFSQNDLSYTNEYLKKLISFLKLLNLIIILEILIYILILLNKKTLYLYLQRFYQIIYIIKNMPKAIY